MTRWFLLAVLVLGWALGPAEASAQSKNFQKRARPTLKWALAELQRIEGMASGCVDGQKIRKRLARVRRQLGYLVPGNKSAPPVPAPAPRQVVWPISAGNFARLMGAVRAQRFSQGKIRTIKQAARRNRFTCRQVSILARSFSLPDYRLKVVRLLARRITDRKSVAVIYGAFPNPMDRRKVTKILSRKR